MTDLRIVLSCTLSNIIWSCHNRHGEKELRLQLPLLSSLPTMDDEDEAEHEYLL